ncbi:MAG: NAD-dependent epimerase/dehydratase family protein [Marinobacterium sp.]|nr:NAD-dependent epimerase/dehydratase family protein [Marinobacterium sp.]
MQILITGASGYIGQHLCQRLTDHHIQPVSLRQTPVEQLELQGIDTVIHLSALVHQPDAPASLYQQINHDQTLALAQAAKCAGVKQFIFFSTMAVYGGHGSLTHCEPLTETSPCQPDSPYGQSKYAAEQALTTLADDEFKLAIIRPPMVYGPNCPGNMTRLQQLVARLPLLPLGYNDNFRSVVALDNLLAMTFAIIEQQASGIFLPQDAKPVSIATLSRLLAQAQQRHRVFFAPPHWSLKLAARLHPRLTCSLFGSLSYDNRLSCQRLNFTPPLNTAQAIKQMCHSATGRYAETDQSDRNRP